MLIDFEKMKHYRQLREEIKELERERSALASGKFPSSWPLMERVSGGGKTLDVTAEVVEKLWNLERMLNGKLELMIEQRVEMEEWLEMYEPEERRMLRLYYVDGLTWEEVAERVGYSSRHLSRIIKRMQMMG